jgi:hypothetical protein
MRFHSFRFWLDEILFVLFKPYLILCKMWSRCGCLRAEPLLQWEPILGSAAFLPSCHSCHSATTLTSQALLSVFTYIIVSPTRQVQLLVFWITYKNCSYLPQYVLKYAYIMEWLNGVNFCTTSYSYHFCVDNIKFYPFSNFRILC